MMALLPCFSRGATVTASLHCLSLKFMSSSTRVLGLTYTLDLSATSSDPANGELYALAPGTSGYSHGTFLRYLDPTFGDPVFLECLLNAPLAADMNTNGVADLLEASQGIYALKTTGAYNDPLWGLSPIRATWTRPEGSAVGTCKLELIDLGLTFTPQFQILEYAGGLTYANQGTNVTGWLRVTNAVQESSQVTGPVKLGQASANRLALTPGTWTNGASQFLTYNPLTTLDRSGQDYLSIIAFDDGDPSTDLADYAIWYLLISDSSDANGNGIPDLSDPVSAVAPPSLSVAVQGRLVVVTISGTVGQTYDVQQSTGLAPATWFLFKTVTLTNALQQLPAVAPSGSPLFWWARSH